MAEIATSINRFDTCSGLSNTTKDIQAFVTEITSSVTEEAVEIPIRCTLEDNISETNHVHEVSVQSDIPGTQSSFSTASIVVKDTEILPVHATTEKNSTASFTKVDPEDHETYSPPNLQLILYNFDKEMESIRLSCEVLNVLERYGRHISTQKPDSNESFPDVSKWPGKAKFFPNVYHHVRKRQMVQLTMPAFPCKSLNREHKVLGPLPDLGEELALCRLNALASDIQKVYKPGAQVNIATDGLLFNDILGIPDDETWDYGEKLKDIMKENNLSNIRFVRPQSILGMLREEDVDKTTYLETIQLCRQEMEKRFGRSDASMNALIKSDKDTELTYCGMKKFLETEMLSVLGGQASGAGGAARRRLYRETAKRMMQRSEAFTLAIRTLRSTDVRLSMHPSSGTAKLSIPLIPTPNGDFQKSPWHSCVMMSADGRYHSVHQDEVKDTHQLVYRNGQPYYYREPTPLHEWEAYGYRFVPQYPHGTAIHAPALDFQKLEAFARVHSAVSVKGFLNIPDGRLIAEQGVKAAPMA